MTTFACPNCAIPLAVAIAEKPRLHRPCGCKPRGRHRNACAASKHQAIVRVLKHSRGGRFQ